MKHSDLAMFILTIALDFGYRGLIPTQISEILLDKFQIKIHPDKIRIALYREKNYVDRKSFTNKINGFKHYYVISDKGILYIKGQILRDENNE